MKNEKRYVIVFDVKMVLCNNTRKVGSKLKKGIKTLAKKDKEKADRVADVLVYSQNLLDKLELDADEIVNMKMKQNEAKYPVDKAKGNATKYTEL